MTSQSIQQRVSFIQSKGLQPFLPLRPTLTKWKWLRVRSNVRCYIHSHTVLKPWNWSPSQSSCIIYICLCNQLSNINSQHFVYQKHSTVNFLTSMPVNTHLCILEMDLGLESSCFFHHQKNAVIAVKTSSVAQWTGTYHSSFGNLNFPKGKHT